MRFTRVIISADLEKVFSLCFSCEMVGITLNSNRALQIHRKKPLSTKLKVTFVSLI